MEMNNRTCTNDEVQHGHKTTPTRTTRREEISGCPSRPRWVRSEFNIDFTSSALRRAAIDFYNTKEITRGSGNTQNA